MEIITYDASQTQSLGRKIADYLIKGGRGKQGTVITLIGELGSGKTSFVQGVAKEFGLPQRILSPTFLIVKRYSLSIPVFDYLYHIDLYRIKKSVELAVFGFSEILADSGNILFIEWPEILREIAIAPKLSLEFTIKDENLRLIKINQKL